MATPSTSSGATMGSRAAIVHAFDGFRAELDEHNDRRERLIKASRDITILSKKTIFLLHRLAAEDAAAGCGAAGDDADADADADAPAPPPLAAAGAQGRAQLAGVQALFRGMRADLAGARFWRYQGAVSPGLQEYIEALAFAHYLERGALVSRAEVQASLSDADGAFFPVSLEEYLLGVSDLTGELMRFAITAISRRGGRTKAREVSDFVRDCKADFDGFTPYVKNLGKKQAVTAQSLLKIEDAAYAMAVRASEYAGSEEILADIVERCVSDVRRRGTGMGTEGYEGEASESTYEEY